MLTGVVATAAAQQATDRSTDGGTDDRAIDALAAQLALPVTRLHVGRYRRRRLARLLDGPVVAFVSVPARLLQRLTALPYDLERT
jgi:hypothetical protein